VEAAGTRSRYNDDGAIPRQAVPASPGYRVGTMGAPQPSYSPLKAAATDSIRALISATLLAVGTRTSIAFAHHDGPCAAGVTSTFLLEARRRSAASAAVDWSAK